MAKNLVIVESPTKARTLERILGSAYMVKASLGHVRDLPADTLGVATDRNFSPTYVIPKGKKPVIKEIQALAETVTNIYLATDPDREGESISWHVLEATGIEQSQVKRVVFHEITESAVKEAFKSSRAIDMHLVDAQQARRILDRLVGYQLSPLLWKKLRWWGLSAGRVQSAALRLVVERQRANEEFTPKEYWTISVPLSSEKPEKPKQVSNTLKATLHSQLGTTKRLSIAAHDEADGIKKYLEGATYTVEEVIKRRTHSRPSPPFITSTLQQEAWRKLHFTARRTMSVAQQLYEGIDLGKEGSVGLITYMRTDSTNLAQSAIEEVRQYILGEYGPDFLPSRPRIFTKKVKGAQEAHEAVRPTSVRRTPVEINRYLNRDQKNLYQLIWKRFVACQMADSISNATKVNIHATVGDDSAGYLFRATGSVVLFPSFRILYFETPDGPEPETVREMPFTLAHGQVLYSHGLEMTQHFTEPPPHYTEATLIKSLEEQGIGRPSTYAAIVSTIQDREYVTKEKGGFRALPLGIVVSDLLTEHFADVVDLGFTAQMEEELDQIASGNREWQSVLGKFYGPFTKDLNQAHENIGRVLIPTKEICILCERPMILKRNRWGRTFLSCSGYPDCRNAQSTQERVGVSCPRCDGDLVQRKGGKGRRRSVFYGCSNYPKCEFSLNKRPLLEECPTCGNILVRERNFAACINQNCDYRGQISSTKNTEEDSIKPK